MRRVQLVRQLPLLCLRVSSKLSLLQKDDIKPQILKQVNHEAVGTKKVLIFDSNLLKKT